MHLKDKVVLLTGGSKGLGKELCIGLLRKEAKVSFCARDRRCGEETVKELQSKYGKDSVTFIECDVVDHDSLEGLFQQTKEHFGSIDIIINNAGLLSEGKHWRDCVAVNLVALIDGCKLAENYLSLQHGGKGGVVLNVASVAGTGLIESPKMPVYSATKAGVIDATRSYAARSVTEKNGIKYVCICPGVTDTGMKAQVETKEGVERSGLEDATPIVFDPAKVNTVESVVNASIDLIETDDNNGAVSLVKENSSRFIHGRGPE